MKLILILATLVLGSLNVSAKDMNHRLGIGPKSPFSIPLPAMALHYSPNSEYTFTGALGIDTEKDNSRLGLQAGVRRIMFEEKNMNFFIELTFQGLGFSIYSLATSSVGMAIWDKS